MAKNVRISDELYALAQVESRLQDRSIAQQLEHWAKLGLAAARSSTNGSVGAMEAAIALTKGLDRLDVQSRRRTADYLHFISRSVARASKPVFPAQYRKS